MTLWGKERPQCTGGSSINKAWRVLMPTGKIRVVGCKKKEDGSETSSQHLLHQVVY